MLKRVCSSACWGTCDGMKTGGEEVDRYVADVLAERGGIGVVGGEGVVVGDEEVALVLVLELDPVVEGAHVVAEVQAAGGTHAGEDAGARVVRGVFSHCGSGARVNDALVETG